MTHILADEDIPLLNELFAHAGTLSTLPHQRITHSECKNQDILLIRSVSSVNAQLLENTAVRFVGSATTGQDHLDTAWLNQAGIHWATAAGCNATAVAQYVVCTVAALQKMDILRQHKPSAAIIGVGRIGKKVAALLTRLGFNIVLCDPFCPQKNTIRLEEIQNVDLITLHTPLTHNGPHPTFHLINQTVLARQKPGCVLINTARGGVISTEDLKKHGQHLTWCFDVFENEPSPDPFILAHSTIVTPHIAGHSIQAKWRGSLHLYHAALAAKLIPPCPQPLPCLPRIRLPLSCTPRDWRDIVLSLFDPRLAQNHVADMADSFYAVRKYLPQRSEFECVDTDLIDLPTDERALLHDLGFSC